MSSSRPSGASTATERRVAQAPVGDIFEQSCVGLGVFLDRLQRGMHGARLRQRQAGVQAEPFRRLVDGDDQLGIAALAVDDERFILSPEGGEVAGEAGRVGDDAAGDTATATLADARARPSP